MKCQTCGCELEEGYLFSTKDGAFSFAYEVPSSFVNAKDAPGFAEVAKPKVGGRTNVPATLCRECKTLVVSY